MLSIFTIFTFINTNKCFDFFSWSTSIFRKKCALFSYLMRTSFKNANGISAPRLQKILKFCDFSMRTTGSTMLKKGFSYSLKYGAPKIWNIYSKTFTGTQKTILTQVAHIDFAELEFFHIFDWDFDDLAHFNG